LIRIETARLVLRTPNVRDLAGYLEYRNDPAALAAQGMAIRDKEDAAAYLRSQAELPLQSGGWRMLAVEERCRQGIIGEVGVCIHTDRDEGDIGWWLNSAWQGRGLAVEAARGLTEWCFTTGGLRRITAHCLAENAASLRVLERIGMRVELRSIESRRIGDQWRNEVGGALLRREWGGHATS